MKDLKVLFIDDKNLIYRNMGETKYYAEYRSTGSTLLFMEDMLGLNKTTKTLSINALASTALSITGDTKLWGNVTVVGDVQGTTKRFRIPYKGNDGKFLIHSSIEGPEHAVFKRGKLNNEDTIILPDFWSWLIDENTLTVHLTPFGNSHASIESVDNYVVKLSNLYTGFYLIIGERKDVDKLNIEE